MPPARWTATSDTLILHGRRICKPKPLCDRCAVREDCHYYRTIIVKARRSSSRSAGGSVVDEGRGAGRGVSRQTRK
jgi:adenine-specific DNA glycosylase